MLTPRRFYFLRHGETDWNREHLAQGQTDIGLNDTGRTQAAAAAVLLRGRGLTCIVASPLRRARETAAIVAAVLALPVAVLDALKEASWGTREGTFPGEWFREWKRGVTPEGAEPYERYLDRALGAVNAALEHDEPILVVAHGGIYWAIERETGVRLPDDIPNATPMLHEPPTAARPAWAVSPVLARVTPGA